MMRTSAIHTLVISLRIPLFVFFFPVQDLFCFRTPSCSVADFLFANCRGSGPSDGEESVMTPETCAIPEELFQRIQSEFLEMPGLRLTQMQACRLWGLDNEVCVLLLARLVDERFLTRTRDGRFMQRDRTHLSAFSHHRAD